MAIDAALAVRVTLALLATTTLIAARAADDSSPTKIVQLGAENFTDAVEKMMDQCDFVLMEFYASWCPTCRAFKPIYEKINDELAAWREANHRVIVARVDCPEGKNYALCTDFNITMYPSMFIGTPGAFRARTTSSLFSISPRYRSQDAVVQQVKAHVLGAAVQEPADGEQQFKRPMFSRRSAWRGQPSADWNDVEGAVVKSWQYLATPPILRGVETRQALAAWLDLLAEAHPEQRCRQGAQSTKEVLSAAWPPAEADAKDPRALKDVSICGETKFAEWSGCKGSMPELRGYTCGVWQLLHALSVGMPESDGQAGRRWLVGARGFIKYFFQCSDCSRHFVDSASTGAAEGVTTKREAVLWMWRTHNAVNERLKKEEAEKGTGDPMFLKRIFPTPALCPKCFKWAGGGWDEDAVYSFLQLFYSSRSPGVMLTGSSGEKSSSMSSSSWALASAVCVAVLAAVYLSLRQSAQYALRKSMSRML